MSSERQENSVDNPWWGEHVHRYNMVFEYIRTPVVALDIACGSGFGADRMASHGLQVTGADISEEAIKQCKKSFKRNNLNFIQADATALPFEDTYFDTIVSFETIEHTTHYLEVLKEFKRTIKTGGIIFLSTPNRTINTPEGSAKNPFHTQEWNYEELQAVLNSVYPQVTILGQQYTRYKHRKSLGAKLAQLTERFFYLRGIRKLPLAFQDYVMRALSGIPMYPTEEDYELVSDLSEIKTCKTFFAICKVK
ncbi:hypothetical protein CNR22_12530 [Sphingobacteriaceae bacterium]|nr:hypothetical protein CNR22_12530 [Sphingobacteriaceae bacterium]